MLRETCSALLSLGRQGAVLVAPNCYRIGYVLPALPGTAVDIVSGPVGDEQVACRISTTDGAELTKALVSRSND